MAMGQWGGFWSSNPIYGRQGPNFDEVDYANRTVKPRPDRAHPGDMVSRYFGNPDTNSQLFWQSREGMPFAYQRALGVEAAPGTDYNQWLQRQEGQVNADFVNRSLTNPDLQYYQHVANQMRNLAERYTQLPSWQQGQGVGSWFAGRRL